jgi:CHASE3 domain sensor protein
MSLDQRLTDAARHIADQLITPEVDLDAVRAQARSNRRRTTILAVVATVAAVVAVVTVADGLATSAPPPQPATTPTPTPTRASS